jgi:hypothetical protein
LSKTKNKSRSAEENSRGIIRELTKENRALKKQLKQYEKYEHKDPVDLGQDDKEVSGDSEDTYVDLKKKIPCPDCGKGFFNEYELMGKIYGTCNICDFRKRLK